MTLGPIMLDVAGHELDAEDRELIAHPQVGAVILFARNYASPEQVQRLVADIHAVKSPRVLVAVDQEGGRVQRLREPFASLPPLRQIGRRYDVDRRAGLALAHECGWLMASEMRAVGIDLSFAPVVDVDRGVSEIIGDRAFHRRPECVAALARAYMSGMREAGMAPTLKHFPGHGAVTLDSHVALPVDRRDADQLKRDLLPFRKLATEAAMGVMTAHVVYPAIDDLPASFSRRWIRAVLRRRFGFPGAVFSDDLSMAGAAAVGSMGERAATALQAGCDMLPVCNDRSAAAALLDDMAGREDPLAQLRLARLHGRGGVPLAELAGDPRHRDAVAQIARLSDTDDFHLDA